jgi:DNA-binding response OmpR family regulator
MKPMNKRHSPCVLIVDDSITDCLLISSSLQQAGFEVSIATDGREGLTKVMANPPQCLILDIILPGINGYAICRQVRARDPQHNIPIIIVSTKSSVLDQNYALSIGADRYLAKPFTAEKLVQTVWGVLPESLRTLVAETRKQAVPQHAALEEDALLNVRTLIPYQQNKVDIMWGNNPFAGNAVMSDQQIRRLYAAIDNHRTVQDLSTMMQIDLQATLKLLETLWHQQYIVFYDVERRLLKEVDFVKLSALAKQGL